LNIKGEVYQKALCLKGFLVKTRKVTWGGRFTCHRELQGTYVFGANGSA
jgi:hypothetical protein